MSVGSAWRRFGVVTQGGMARPDDSRVSVAPAARAMWRAVWRCAKALSVVAALVLGSIALVQILDVMLDRLRDWI